MADGTEYEQKYEEIDDMSPRCIRISVVIPFFLAFVIGQASMAATINAANCSSSAVQSAISNAQAGDIVAVPAGNCSWASFSIPGGVHVRGAGIGASNVTVTGTVTINKHSSRNVELSGFSFSKSGGGNSAKMFRVTGSWQNEPPLIHDNEFTVSNAAIFLYETNGGVIYNNVFRGASDDSAIQHKMNNDTQSWSTADTMGIRDTDGKRNLYVEDNLFEGMVNQATDFDDAARVVFRHNTLNHSSFNSHGLATSPIGVRHYEIYNNTFAYPNTSVNQNWHIWLRGGTGVIFDNDVEDIRGSQWGNKSELLLSVRAAVDGGVGGCCRTWACAHQVGQNHDGNTQFLDALTLWNNSGTLAYGLNDGWSNSCGQNMSNYLQNGRDVVFATNAKNGYTPYTYPHPLRVDTVRPMGPQDLTVIDP
ncbi:MAG: hypothetical protein RLN69_14535 [Woeseiaceae bacterium]